MTSHTVHSIPICLRDEFLRIPAAHSKRRTGQHYTGFDFWLTKLNQFNGDYLKAEMVKAFFTSSEYRQRFGNQ